MKTATISAVLMDRTFDPPTLIVRFVADTGQSFSRRFQTVDGRKNIRHLVMTVTGWSPDDDELNSLDYSCLVGAKFDVPREAD